MKVAVKKMEEKMNKIEIFSAGCPFCEEAVKHINEEVCESCEIIVHDLRDSSIAERARKYGVKRAPAVDVNGNLSRCCKCQDIHIAV